MPPGICKLGFLFLLSSLLCGLSSSHLCKTSEERKLVELPKPRLCNAAAEINRDAVGPPAFEENVGQDVDKTVSPRPFTEIRTESDHRLESQPHKESISPQAETASPKSSTQAEATVSGGGLHYHQLKTENPTEGALTQHRTHYSEAQKQWLILVIKLRTLRYLKAPLRKKAQEAVAQQSQADCGNLKNKDSKEESQFLHHELLSKVRLWKHAALAKRPKPPAEVGTSEGVNKVQETEDSKSQSLWGNVRGWLRVGALKTTGDLEKPQTTADQASSSTQGPASQSKPEARERWKKISMALKAASRLTRAAKIEQKLDAGVERLHAMTKLMEIPVEWILQFAKILEQLSEYEELQAVAGTVNELGINHITSSSLPDLNKQSSLTL